MKLFININFFFLVLTLYNIIFISLFEHINLHINNYKNIKNKKK